MNSISNPSSLPGEWRGGTENSRLQSRLDLTAAVNPLLGNFLFQEKNKVGKKKKPEVDVLNMAPRENLTDVVRSEKRPEEGTEEIPVSAMHLTLPYDAFSSFLFSLEFVLFF